MFLFWLVQEAREVLKEVREGHEDEDGGERKAVSLLIWQQSELVENTVTNHR